MKRIYVILDNIRSAFNVGSFFRTADAVGGCTLFLCGITATPENPKLIKTALGAANSVPWRYFSNTMEAINDLKKRNIPIFSVELTDQAQHFQKIKYPNELALVFGHERKGVAQPILDLSDEHIYIPMNGIKESLNVATSAGIILYEVVR